MIRAESLIQRRGLLLDHDTVRALRRFLGSGLGAALGATLLGAWAAWVNRDAGLEQALRSGAGQFLLSAFVTWTDARAMDWLFAQFQRTWVGAAAAAIGSLAGTYSLVVLTHWQLDTPHILLTLLPGLLPTVGYTALYTTLLVQGCARATSVREFSGHV